LAGETCENIWRPKFLCLLAPPGKVAAPTRRDSKHIFAIAPTLPRIPNGAALTLACSFHSAIVKIMTGRSSRGIFSVHSGRLHVPLTSHALPRERRERNRSLRCHTPAPGAPHRNNPRFLKRAEDDWSGGSLFRPSRACSMRIFPNHLYKFLEERCS